MNPLGPPDSYVVAAVMSTLVYSVATVLALALLEVIVYIAMVVDLLRGTGDTRVPGAAASGPRGTRADRARHPLRHQPNLRTAA